MYPATVIGNWIVSANVAILKWLDVHNFQNLEHNCFWWSREIAKCKFTWYHGVLVPVLCSFLGFQADEILWKVWTSDLLYLLKAFHRTFPIISWLENEYIVKVLAANIAVRKWKYAPENVKNWLNTD